VTRFTVGGHERNVSEPSQEVRIGDHELRVRKKNSLIVPRFGDKQTLFPRKQFHVTEGREEDHQQSELKGRDHRNQTRSKRKRSKRRDYVRKRKNKRWHEERQGWAAIPSGVRLDLSVYGARYAF